MDRSPPPPVARRATQGLKVEYLSNEPLAMQDPATHKPDGFAIENNDDMDDDSGQVSARMEILTILAQARATRESKAPRRKRVDYARRVCGACRRPWHALTLLLVRAVP